MSPPAPPTGVEEAARAACATVAGDAGPGLRVGVDLVAVDQVAASVARHGDRYLRRLFTAAEVASCSGAPDGLAARFAAKEAVVKILRPDGPRPPWTSVEVRRHPGGWCDLHLTGPADRSARAAGLGWWSVSLSHEGGWAVAVVVAGPSPSPRPPAPAGSPTPRGPT